MMVMSVRDSTLFVLNGTAAALWESLDGHDPARADRVAADLARSTTSARTKRFAMPKRSSRSSPRRGLLVLSESPSTGEDETDSRRP